jgi:hypothetical protein
LNDTPVLNPIQAFAHDHYRLTRALWFLLNAPDAGRHDALLAEDIPDIYRRLFDAILDGTRGLARIALEDGPELALLEVVDRLPRPAKIPPRRTDPDLPDYAAALFEHVADLQDEGLDLGGGDWPGAPAHTCAAKEATGTALIIRANETRGARMFNPTWRTCPACLHNRVKRIARQTLITIAAAGAMQWAILDAADFRRWAGNVRQHRRRTGDEARYRAIPQDDGRVFVMSTHGLAGGPVPTDRRALYDLIKPYAITPDGKRASSSRGFGGDYKRLRGDGRDEARGVRLWTDARLEDVAGALGAEVKRGRNAFRVQIDAHESYSRLAAAGIAMHARKGQGNGLQQLIDATTPDVTLKVQGEESEPLYLKRDRDDGGGDIAPPGQPPLFDSGGQEVRPCAIYLP